MNSRNINIDKAKGLLIFFVVFGHFLERYIGWSGEISKPLLSFIYAIHMPAFIFIAGMFFNLEKWRENFYRYFSIFIVFQVLYVFFEVVVNNGSIAKWVSTPYWIMWFMFTLSVYCLIVPILIKHKMALFISVALSVYIGLVSTDNYPFSIGRTLSFLPFFIFGVLCGKQTYRLLFEIKSTVIISIALLMLLATSVYFLDINPQWLFGVANIHEYYSDVILAIFIKMSLILTSLLSLFAILRLSEFAPSFIASFGENSLSIYLLHGFFVILIAQNMNFDLSAYSMIVVCFALTLATCIVLKENIFEAAVNQLSKPLVNVFK